MNVRFTLVQFVSLLVFFCSSSMLSAQSATNEDTGETFSSIQAAIDDTDTDNGDVITVVAGTYTEDVTVDKELMLNGPNAGIPGNSPSRMAEATIEGQVIIEASNVTFDGFDVNAPDATSNATAEALRISNTNDNVTVQNNIVRDFGEAGIPAWEGLDAIVAFGGSASDAITNVSINNNLVKNVDGLDTQGGAAGISIQGNVSGATVNDNVIENIGELSTAFAFGVVVRGTGNHSVTPSSVTVQNNSISDISSNPATIFKGVGLELEAGTATFVNNTVNNAELLLEDKTMTLSAATISSNNSFDKGAYSSGGNIVFASLQDAIDAASSGDDIIVLDGTYNENININKPLTLESINGASSTSIVGSDVALGTVTLPSGSSGITIDGFTIVGYDGANPGLEKAAVYLQGAQTNITIQNNEIVADGEAGLLSEFNAAIDNIVIDNNIFSGKTFVGTTPGDCGFSNQFTAANVPRQLVVMGGGSGVSNSTNVTFTNNQVTGTAGAPKPGCNPPFDYQGNTLVTLDIINASITGNSFSGSTGRFAAALRARGTNTTISGNTFDGSNIAPVAAYVFTDSDALVGATPGTLNGVLSANTFTPAGVISGTSIFPCGSSAPPAPWQSADIGSSGTAGNDASFDSCEGEFAVSGGGNNAISSTTDNVSFVYQSICGNGMITAKVESITPNGYGGLMIREATAAGSKQVSIFSNLTNVLRHESRKTANAAKTVQSHYRPFPFWLRLQRMGDWVFAYYSTTGTSFNYVHAVYAPMDNCVEIGLASFTYLPNAQTEAVFSNVSVSGSAALAGNGVPDFVQQAEAEQLPNSDLRPPNSDLPFPTSDLPLLSADVASSEVVPNSDLPFPTSDLPLLSADVASSEVVPNSDLPFPTS
ncbi:MAG: hypothetical protein GVY26_09360, partial [Bacteroidetes bacterium]|nr:hypothetical protein [Bacteroidota bacterium]